LAGAKELAFKQLDLGSQHRVFLLQGKVGGGQLIEWRHEKE